MELFDLIATGQLAPGMEREAVVQRLVALFKCTPEQAERLVAGRAVAVKKGVERETAERYDRQLQQAGVITDLRVQRSFAAPVPISTPPHRTTITPQGGKMELRTSTLLVVVCLIFSFMIDIYSIADNMQNITWKYPLKAFLQLPIIIFFAILWHRQRSETK